MPATNTDFNKLIIALRFYLLGKGYYQASEALELGKSIHCGTRVDKITPEFQHQIEIVHYLRTLENHLLFPEQTYCVALLHDSVEDYPGQLSFDRVAAKFGNLVRNGVHACTKSENFDKLNQTDYFDLISTDPIGSVVKGADRINNMGSMVGVFSKDKQTRYVKEVEDYFFPMLKEARRMFPAQEAVYENIKFILTSQVSLVKEILANE